VRWSNLGNGVMGLALVVMMSVLPYVYYRHNLTHSKRLRPIEEGRAYRSGCLTATGFRDAIVKYKIKTVINLQEENQDPDLPASYFNTSRERESEICRSLGAKLAFVFVELVSAEQVGKERPPTIDRFLEIMDDPANYPVLIHCKAGLHRTGILAAVYRMEYQHWNRFDAWHELRAHGFGEFVSDASNNYITQYVLSYEPGHRRFNRGYTRINAD
jgi:tyrosine-protein phosphatase SIW14